MYGYQRIEGAAVTVQTGADGSAELELSRDPSEPLSDVQQAALENALAPLDARANDPLKLEGQFHTMAALYLNERTFVEPDLCLYPRRILPEDVKGRDVLLAIEVAASSMPYDLGLKAQIYARHGVGDADHRADVGPEVGRADLALPGVVRFNRPSRRKVGDQAVQPIRRAHVVGQRGRPSA